MTEKQKEDALKRFKNQRSTDFTIVLNDDWDGLVLKNVRNVYHTLMCAELPLVYLAVVYHDKDLRDDKTLKTPHYHVVLQLSRSCRIGTIINTLLDVFNGLTESLIEIDKCNSLSGQSRYLIHLDDYDKYQYKEDDVLTNEREVFKGYLEQVPKVCDIKDIITICKHFNYSLEKIMLALGKDNYKEWRFVIADLRRERGF